MEDTADTVQWVVLKADSKLFFWQGGQGTEEMKRYPSRLISLFSRAYMLKVLVDIYLSSSSYSTTMSLSSSSLHLLYITLPPFKFF